MPVFLIRETSQQHSSELNNGCWKVTSSAIQDFGTGFKDLVNRSACACQFSQRGSMAANGISRILRATMIAAILLCQPLLAAADKVRMSISSIDVAFLSAGVAQKRGMFRDEKLEVELIRMNANVSVMALSTLDTDYTMVFASVVRGALRGMPMKVVASYMDSSTHLLIARPEYKSLKELKGKTLAVSVYGTTSDVAARMMFKHAGVDPERELKIVPLGSERQRYSALREGIVDVAVLSPPTDAEAARSGFRVLSRFYELYKMPFTGLGAHARKIKEKPDEVKRMIKALLRANRYVRQNREGTIQTMMDWIRIDREAAAATYDATWRIFSEDGDMPEAGLKLVVDQARDAMKIERAVANSEVADFRLLREAQKELGIIAR
jgi:ABC-type nitrate/sulfonate/bicarbonate transport system substrate-binding protein